MKRRVSIIALVMVLFLVGCGKFTDEKDQVSEDSYKKVVEVYKGQLGDLKRTFSMTGVFESYRTIRIVPKIQGIEEVEKIQVIEGQFVKAGDILSTIDDDNVRDSINSARASYQLSKDSYEKGIENYNNTYENLKRTEKLFEEGAVTKQELEKAQIMASENELDILKSQLDIAKLNFENQKKLLDDVILSSPIDGVVSKMNIEEKGYVSSQSFIEISQIDKLKLKVKLPQEVAKSLKVEEQIDISLVTSEDNVLGTVKSINYVPEDISNLYNILIEISNSNYSIKPGMFGEITINLQDKKETILLPVDSVLNDSQGSHVYIIVNDKAIKKYIQVGEDNGEEIEVIGGIDISNQVVISGQEFLEDGVSVVVVRGE